MQSHIENESTQAVQAGQGPEFQEEAQPKVQQATNRGETQVVYQEKDIHGAGPSGDAEDDGASAADPKRFVVRRLQRSDLPALAALLSQLSTVGEVSDEALEGFWRVVQNNERHVIAVVSSSSGEVYGAATLLVEPKLLHGASSVGHIEDVVVDDRVRGYGLGKLVVQHLVGLAHAAGCYKVILDCETKNIPFYERCGLEEHGHCMAVYF